MAGYYSNCYLCLSLLQGTISSWWHSNWQSVTVWGLSRTHWAFHPAPLLPSVVACDLEITGGMYGFAASSWCFVHLKNAQPCPFRLSRYVFFTTAEFSKLDSKQLHTKLKEEGHQYLNFQYLQPISFPQFQFSFLLIFNWTGSHHGNYSSWRVKSVKR